MNFEHVAGKENSNKITLYALSTCVWCKRTKDLLSSLGVAFDYVYVDLLKGEDRSEAVEQVKKHNASLSFPTIVIGDRSIIGFREEEIKEAVA